MFTQDPPSINTSLMKFLPTWTWIMVIWWSIAIVAQAGSSWTSWTNLINLKMYHSMSSTIFKSCPKLIKYLVSKTWILMSFKISSKVFFGDIVCGINWIGCLLIIDWFIGFSRPNQFEWSGLFKSMDAYDIKSFPCNSLIVRTKESCNCSSVYQLIIVFAFIGSCSLKACYFGTWICVVITTTLIGTLSSLEFFCYYSGSSCWLSPKHVLNFCLSKTIRCTNS